MSTPLTPTNILEFRIYSQDSEQGAVNTVHYEVDSVTGSPTDDMAGEAFNSAIRADFLDLITSVASYRGISTRILNRIPKPAVVLFPDPGPGTGGAIGAPRQSAPLLQFKTAFSGSAGRGRLYIPFMPAANLAANGECNPAYVLLMAALLAALQGFTTFTNAGNTANLHQVVYSRATGFGTAITEWNLTNQIATQKRRGSFGRPNSSPM